MTITADDNMTRTIGSLVWAYGQVLSRSKRVAALDEPPPPALLKTEREMENAYRVALELRHEELREYARQFGVTMDELDDGSPMDSWRGLVTFALPLIVCKIERKRVGDEAFSEGCLPPEGEACG